MNVALSSASARPKYTLSSSSSSNLKSNSKYRPAVILPGLGNNSGDYKKLEATLNDKYGVSTFVADVSRLDWLRNAAGLVDPNYWRGTLQPTPVLQWYLNRVHDAVQKAEEEQVSLIGHSAGGWLGRLYIQQYGSSHVSLLLSLGTPHLPPPKADGVFDQTRGLLRYVHQHCPPPVYTPHLKYVCIAGRYIQGAPLFAKSIPDDEEYEAAAASILNTTTTTAPITTSPPISTITLRARFVGQGYKQVCGKADVWGDGIVPEASAHLEGALNISLDGVYHSPVGSDDVLRPWYGSPAVLEQWVEHLLN
ncbi:hypothetical protein RIF29_08392 [Crotalaria pallida]|uniref:GPI inositol-deacylase n=1 Tax=Crotalaria pallida TaxID=3830 RepID=A0AAN9FQQ2_CROPI